MSKTTAWTYLAKPLTAKGKTLHIGELCRYRFDASMVPARTVTEFFVHGNWEEEAHFSDGRARDAQHEAATGRLIQVPEIHLGLRRVSVFGRLDDDAVEDEDVFVESVSVSNIVLLAGSDNPQFAAQASWYRHKRHTKFAASVFETEVGAEKWLTQRRDTEAALPGVALNPGDWKADLTKSRAQLAARVRRAAHARAARDERAAEAAAKEREALLRGETGDCDNETFAKIFQARFGKGKS